MADQRVLSNNPRHNCRKHFSISSLIVSKVTNHGNKMQYDQRRCLVFDWHKNRPQHAAVGRIFTPP